MQKNPSGLLTSEASFARYFVGASPIDTVSPVSSKIRFLILRAVSEAGPNSFSVPDKSIKASSIESC